MYVLTSDKVHVYYILELVFMIFMLILILPLLLNMSKFQRIISVHLLVVSLGA